ncbi:MAG: CPBP family intramembrane metalloprotease [Oscillospiraceae bacterium]|nr:CPBP family intramembrane metalloprotease [Oscillospiraceae bacterium]MDD3260315.1 CPBP family intramembrane metalloprotease [Oscillospiraceae bacterium]
MERKKSELFGVLGRILAYVIVISVFESIYASRGGQAWRIIPSAVILGLLLAGMAKGRDFERLGFAVHTPMPWRKALFLLPMIVVSTANLWHGAVLRYAPLDTVWYIIAMLCIGFIEEILFRGYLLQLLLKRSTRLAILISSLTFALGHIVNLANGAELVPTLLQLVYALAIGLMLSVFVVKTGHLLPCCLFHGVFNALAAFSKEAGQTVGYQIAVCAVISLLSVGYAVYLWRRKLPELTAEMATKESLI